MMEGEKGEVGRGRVFPVGGVAEMREISGWGDEERLVRVGMREW